MINLVMTLRKDANKKRPDWKQIALAMSAKEWTSSSGRTYTMEFTAKVCKNRYSYHKGAFIAPKNVTWTEERHLHLMGLVKDRTDEDGLVYGWKQIALDMSAKEWTSSEGETHTLEFTAKACLNRYYRHQKTEDGTNSLTSASTTITPRETTHTNTVDKDVEEMKEEEE